jgi:hypothetical protein
VRLQGAQQPVHRGLGQADPVRDLGHAQARGPRAEHGEDLRRALYRLDHDNLSAMPNNIQDMT